MGNSSVDSVHSFLLYSNGINWAISNGNTRFPPRIILSSLGFCALACRQDPRGARQSSHHAPYEHSHRPLARCGNSHVRHRGRVERSRVQCLRRQADLQPGLLEHVGNRCCRHHHAERSSVMATLNV